MYEGRSTSPDADADKAGPRGQVAGEVTPAAIDAIVEPVSRSDDLDDDSEANAAVLARLSDLDRERLIEIRDFTVEMLDKKYDLYEWCESKIRTLVAIDGILLGTLALVFGQAGFNLNDAYNAALAATTVLVFTASLAIGVYHVHPRMWSGQIENERHPRTVKGTEAYASSAEYANALVDLDLPSTIMVNVDQIRGMNRNIWKNQRAIHLGVVTTLVGLIPMLIVFGRAYL